MSSDRCAHAVGIGCKPERKGFWFRVIGSEGQRFWFTYVAVGVGGHQTIGEVAGRITDGDWEYQVLHFPVMHVGITSFDVSLNGHSVLPASLGPGESISSQTMHSVRDSGVEDDSSGVSLAYPS